MNGIILCIIVFLILLALELLYFRIADRFNIIDRPNERSSHSSIVLRGGGIIFALAMIVWAVVTACRGGAVVEYAPFLVGLVMIAGVSFVDDIRSLPDSVRLVVQFVAMILLLWNVSGGAVGDCPVWVVALAMFVALIVCVGATNVFNFMDGINGITGGYSLAVLVPLLIMDNKMRGGGECFIETSLLVFALLSVLVFCLFNFRPRGKAKCFAGDVGSISIAFILLFAIGRLVVATGDVTWLIFLLVYGVDGVLTICHRILLHENLGEAHRKHAFQLMANELKMSHVVVSLLYMCIQLAVSFGFIYLCPDTAVAHWIYLLCALAILSSAYILFMKKYYWMHEEYLASVEVSNRI